MNLAEVEWKRRLNANGKYAVGYHYAEQQRADGMWVAVWRTDTVPTTYYVVLYRRSYLEISGDNERGDVHWMCRDEPDVLMAQCHVYELLNGYTPEKFNG